MRRQRTWKQVLLGLYNNNPGIGGAVGIKVIVYEAIKRFNGVSYLKMPRDSKTTRKPVEPPIKLRCQQADLFCRENHL